MLVATKNFSFLKHIALKFLTRKCYHLPELLSRKNNILINIYLNNFGLLRLPNKVFHINDSFSTSNTKFLDALTSSFDLAEKQPIHEIIAISNQHLKTNTTIMAKLLTFLTK